VSTEALIFVDIAIVVACAKAVGCLFGRFRQPAVMGEIVAGILLGPTVLGAFPGDPSSALFPDSTRPALEAIGQLGLVVFMFHVGLEFDVRRLGRWGRTLTTVSLASVVLPFALGLALAAILYPAHKHVGGETVGFTPFALFIGTAVSLTAFPVLARILRSFELHRSEVGLLAIGSAAIVDLIGWFLLAAALATSAGEGGESLVRIAAEFAALVAVLVLVVRPLLRHLIARRPGHDPVVITAVLVSLLASAAASEEIGLHAVLGAFLVGAVLSGDESRELAADLAAAVLPFVVAVLLPVYFLLPGLAIDLRHLGSTGAWEIALVLGVACVGKLGGATAGARVSGLPWRTSATLGVLLNTRGLIELVVLSIGLSVGVLDTQLFGVMVVMALVTTLMTGPLLTALMREASPAWRAADVRDAARTPR
jgi:Kef-type K+ transport system membrane component KefB